MEFPVIDFKKTGNRIKQLCRQKKLKPADIKSELRLSCVQTVYKWFQGENIPSIENFYALSLLLHVSIEELIVLKKSDRDTKNMEFSLCLEHKSRKKKRLFAYYKRIAYA